MKPAKSVCSKSARVDFVNDETRSIAERLDRFSVTLRKFCLEAVPHLLNLQCALRSH